MKNLTLIVLLFFALITTVNGGTYRIEAEDMPNLEDWVISTNSDASQGEYLYSVVSGTTNKIKATFDLPESGTYYLWCRALSYNQGWRTISIELNGATDSAVFGDEIDGNGTSHWVCSSGSDYTLKEYANTLAITPNSAYSRWDVIILTTDSNFTMPNTRTELEQIPKIIPKKFGIYRIEAEDMPSLSDWTISTNSDASQGEYLSSVNTGTVNKIKAAFDLPESGTYYLWCRALSYNQGWRTIFIRLNGTTDSTTFGDEVDGDGTAHWVCSAGSTYTLEQYDNTLAVTPNSEYSRWDVIILTTDSNFTMPNTKTELENIQKLMPRKINTYRVEVEDCLLQASWRLSYDALASQGKYLTSDISGETNKINTVLNLPEEGDYYLWAQTFSFNQGYRTSTLAINGTTESVAFGDVIDGISTAHWVNQEGQGIYTLENFDNTLEIIPNSQYSRLDVIIFTTDKYYEFPDNRDDLERIPKLIPSLRNCNKIKS